MIDASNNSILEVTSVVVRVYWDQCTSNFVVSETYSNTDYQYEIEATEMFITIPAWTSNYCDTWARGITGLENLSQYSLDTNIYPFARLDEQRTFTVIPPYSVRFNQSGNMRWGIQTNNYAYMGMYTIQVHLWDGGDSTWATRVNTKTDTV